MNTGTITTVRLDDVEARLTVRNPNDWIQREFLQGRFYEERDLRTMALYMDKNTRYLDIGANIGNHIIYFAKKFELESIVAIEPNNTAIEILKENLALNGLMHKIDLSCLGYGLSDTDTRANIIVPQHNLGGALCRVDKEGEVEIVRGDSLLAGKNFDFMKIDVEGMEIKCLTGCKELIARCRPVIYIEVDNANENAFNLWCSNNDYLKRARIKHYVENQNYLVTPAVNSS